MKASIWKWLILILVVASSLALVIPPSKKVKLGLDLNGGTSYTLQIDESSLEPGTSVTDARDQAIEVVRNRVDRIIEWGLTKIIGKSEFLLTTVWTNETDDKNFIARLSPNIMSLLGITDNDKVVIKYGEKNITVRVLANPELGDYEIGIPANARALLNMYSVNDVVVVARDMRHTFKRNSQAQTIAILGTVLAVFQVIQQLWVGVLLCVIFIPLIIYFSLNEERIKVK